MASVIGTGNAGSPALEQQWNAIESEISSNYNKFVQRDKDETVEQWNSSKAVFMEQARADFFARAASDGRPETFSEKDRLSFLEALKPELAAKKSSTDKYRAIERYNVLSNALGGDQARTAVEVGEKVVWGGRTTGSGAEILERLNNPGAFPLLSRAISEGKFMGPTGFQALRQHLQSTTDSFRLVQMDLATAIKSVNGNSNGHYWIPLAQSSDPSPTVVLVEVSVPPKKN